MLIIIIQRKIECSSRINGQKYAFLLKRAYNTHEIWYWGKMQMTYSFWSELFRDCATLKSLLFVLNRKLQNLLSFEILLSSLCCEKPLGNILILYKQGKSYSVKHSKATAYTHLRLNEPPHQYSVAGSEPCKHGIKKEKIIERLYVFATEEVFTTLVLPCGRKPNFTIICPPLHPSSFVQVIFRFQSFFTS